MCHVVRFVHQRCWGVAWFGNSLVATSTRRVCVMRFVRNDFAISSFGRFYGLIMFDSMPGHEYFSGKSDKLRCCIGTNSVSNKHNTHSNRKMCTVCFVPFCFFLESLSERFWLKPEVRQKKKRPHKMFLLSSC